MATTNRKRSTSAKSTAKPAEAKPTETKTDQPAVEGPKATPEAGESAATPTDASHSVSSPSPVNPIESAAPGDSQEAAPSEQATVTGDGSGEALPPVDLDAGERTAAGVNDEDQEEIPALFIRTRKPILRRRRCGHVFTPEGHGIALSGLTAKQIAAFEGDPTLIVEECSFPAKPDEDE
ncbi:hypothetical protein [Salinicola rhizosphaerae]|uniref:Mu-like prophage FluMu N-terminal domain-containing protein n=1 Tax=Salinicola rhizosphaerae TaxID=1443141 RepID=A0ABQ3E642_9GAMM|nr:hypothetical protein [Salinicola rhizosphaerae]GHB24406.1 hypothetical protein GCM10009038_24360 [Salinicola rhizosphaerae]